MNEKEFLKYLDDLRQERFRVKLNIDKGRIVDLVIQYESLINDNCREIVVYDFAHGFFHRDVIFPDGSQDKYRIDIDDLEIAAIFAEQDLKDKWEFYRDRYLKLM